MKSRRGPQELLEDLEIKETRDRSENRGAMMNADLEIQRAKQAGETGPWHVSQDGSVWGEGRQNDQRSRR